MAPWAVLVILLVIGVSILWEMWKTGPLGWLRNFGVGLATVGELLRYMVRQRQFALLPLLIERIRKEKERVSSDFVDEGRL